MWLHIPGCYGWWRRAWEEMSLFWASQRQDSWRSDLMQHNHSYIPHYQKQARKPSFLVQQLVLAHFKQQVWFNFTSEYLQRQMFPIYLPTLRKHQVPPMTTGIPDKHRSPPPRQQKRAEGRMGSEVPFGLESTETIDP